jgi:hypothetical protein|tara:strand:+ start:1172 stop:1315 length:144 start_codon:yes stop_codon:yes gene_type:complete
MKQLIAKFKSLFKSKEVEKATEIKPKEIKVGKKKAKKAKKAVKKAKK